MRLVLDTNVVIAAFLWDGIPRLLLTASRERRVDLFTSAALLDELTAVLERRKFETTIAASLLTIDAIVDRYAELAKMVRPEPTTQISADPDDDVVLGTALAAKADLIVSGDSHLLTLKTYQSISIMTPAAALDRIG
jgi:putative PIN family toxin of toxin-antitoxin system